MTDRPLLQVGSLYALREGSPPRWRVTAILHRAPSYDDVLLEHLEHSALTSRARIYHPGLNPTDLTLPALVRVLDGAYRAEHGLGGAPLSEHDRDCLADYLSATTSCVRPPGTCGAVNWAPASRTRPDTGWTSP